VYSNLLRTDSRHAIEQLEEMGNIRTVMVTGDNLPCAHRIAEEVGICDHVPLFVGQLREDDNNIEGVDWVLKLPSSPKQQESNIDVQQQLESTLTTEILLDQTEMLQSGLVQLAVTGPVFAKLIESKQIKPLLRFIRVFARMTPQDKVETVKLHIGCGKVVGFVGDGGNDCGAL